MIRQLDIGGARRVRLAVPGGELAALQAGKSADPAVLLLPGYTGSKEDFGPILDAIAADGFGVTALDLRGQYESPGADVESAYTPDAIAQDVLAVAAELGEQVHLLGHSFGGLVARAAAIAAPGRFASLTLMDSGPAGIDGGRRQRMDLLRPVLAEHGIEAVFAGAQYLAEQDPAYVAPPPQLARFLHDRFVVSVPAMLLGMGDALIGEPDRVAELAATGLPFLVLTGSDDDAWPVPVQAEMAHRLEAAYVVIDGAAHSPAVENPPATAAALSRFWHSV